MATQFYAALPERQKHSHGAVIVAGQSQGKSHWVKQEPQWLDADLLLGQYPPSQLQAKAADVETLVRLGAWVVSSTWWDLNNFDGAVAVVSVPRKTLQERTRLKSFDFDEAAGQADALCKAAKKAGVPVFSSFGAAKSHATVRLSKAYASA